MRDVGCFRRPRRDSSWTWDDEQKLALILMLSGVRPVAQQSIERLTFACLERVRALDEVPEVGSDGVDLASSEARQQLGDAKRRQGVAPAQREKLCHRREGRKCELYADLILRNRRGAQRATRSQDKNQLGVPREHCIHCHQPSGFCHRLSDKHAIEWIAMVLRYSRSQGAVLRANWQLIEAALDGRAGNLRRGSGEVTTSWLRLDRDFPDAYNGEAPGCPLDERLAALALLCGLGLSDCLLHRRLHLLHHRRGARLHD